MIKHGMSHAGVALTAIVAGEVLSKKVIEHWPVIEHELAARIQPILVRNDIDIDTYRTGVLITIAIFGFLWGATFKKFTD